MVKYSGLTKFARASCCSTAVLPRISKVWGHPLLGGVALLEMPAEITPGMADPLAKLGEIGCSFRPAVECVFVDGNADGHHTVRVVTQRPLHHAGKSLDGRACS